MLQETNKILCPWHKEDTPSCHIYSDSYFCFGCGKYGPLSHLPSSDNFVHKPAFSTYMRKENIERTFAYIATLPIKEVRGLELPYDNRGYYIVYPGQQYYLLRKWDAEKAKKCYYPTGHSKPIFEATKDSRSRSFCYIVEGQLNAMSLSLAEPNFTVYSPGGASDLCNKKYYTHYAPYANIVIMCDEDAAGIVNGMQLKADLILQGKNVVLHTMPKDLNDILQERGVESVREEAEKAARQLGEGTR